MGHLVIGLKHLRMQARGWRRGYYSNLRCTVHMRVMSFLLIKYNFICNYHSLLTKEQVYMRGVGVTTMCLRSGRGGGGVKGGGGGEDGGSKLIPSLLIILIVTIIYHQ